jgi:hypothetical protein
LLDRFTSYELSELMALDAIEPFGERRRDIQVATICATLVNLQKRKGQKADPISKFLLDYWGEDREPLSLVEKIARARAHFTASPTASPSSSPASQSGNHEHHRGSRR